MQLKHITIDNCPCCGSKTVAESQRFQHVNGQFFENRSFACGYVVEWVPNFSKLRTSVECPKNPEIVEKNNKRLLARDSIVQFIKSLDVDDAFKTSAERAISGSSFWI